MGAKGALAGVLVHAAVVSAGRPLAAALSVRDACRGEGERRAQRDEQPGADQRLSGEVVGTSRITDLHQFTSPGGVKDRYVLYALDPGSVLGGHLPEKPYRGGRREAEVAEKTNKHRLAWSSGRAFGSLWPLLVFSATSASPRPLR